MFKRDCIGCVSIPSLSGSRSAIDMPDDSFEEDISLRPVESAGPIHGNNNGRLLANLSDSALYRQYERAFTTAIGVPLSLRAVETWQLPYHGRAGENRFCAYLATRSRSCAACLRTAQHLAVLARDRPATITCPSGLSEMAVPIRVNNRLAGFLQTGQVFTKPPNKELFERTAVLLKCWGVPVRKRQLRSAFFETRVLTPAQHQAIVTMLRIFAQHLAVVGDQMITWRFNSEPPVIRRARVFIAEHLTEDLPLNRVARAVNVSSFYFCKLFKKATSLNFVDYVTQLRIQKAKNLLLNPDCHVCEIAYEIGFQSLTHFNRVFKKLTGESPSKYRAHFPLQ